MSIVESSPSPVASNAPKFGTLVPNRVFVGGISASTTEAELHALFSKYGNVRATKIISDRAGVSKGYGFVTFETEEEARRIQKEADNLILKERKLNIAPAIKKQPFARIPDQDSPLKDTPLYYDSAPLVSGGALMFNNAPFGYQNGPSYLAPQEPQYSNTQAPIPFYFTSPQVYFQPPAPQYPTGPQGPFYCAPQYDQQVPLNFLLSPFSLPTYPQAQDVSFSPVSNTEGSNIQMNPFPNKDNAESINAQKTQKVPFKVSLVGVPRECTSQRNFPNYFNIPPDINMRCPSPQI